MQITRYSPASRGALVLAALALSIIVLAAARSSADPVLSVTGSNSYVHLGNPASLQIPSGAPLTVEGWIRFNAFTNVDMLYSRNNAPPTRGTTYSYMFGVGGTGTLMRAYTGAGGSPANTWRDITLPAPLETARWYHLAFSYDGTNLFYYLDGVRVGSHAFSYGNTAAHTVKIGGYSDASDVDGANSDVRVWTVARTEAEIQLLMARRLSGREPGLRGYWPLNEGSGTTALDATTNAAAGTLVNASWTTGDDLALQPAPSGFAYASPFAVAHPQTGSTRFTGTNQVVLASFPIPPGYDRFQITESGDAGALGAWESAASAPGYLVAFTQPDADTNVTLYAWFTNSTESVTLCRSEAGIRYTTAAPLPAIRATLSRVLAPTAVAVVNGLAIDNGSTGGTSGGEPLAVHGYAATWLSGPSGDSTPEAPHVTLTETGVYTVALTVMNEAGNTNSASGSCSVTVSDSIGLVIWTGSTNTDWFEGANWNTGLPPGTDDPVAVTSAPRAAVVTNLTASLGDLNIQTGGIVSFSGAAACLRARDVTVHGGGIVRHEPNGTWPAADTNRVFVQARNLTVNNST